MLFGRVKSLYEILFTWAVRENEMFAFVTTASRLKGGKLILDDMMCVYVSLWL